MYVDESGDVGMVNSPTRFFALVGLVVHELRWQASLARLSGFRHRIRTRFGLPLRRELHAAEMISRGGAFKCIPRNDRLTIVRWFADELATIPDLNLIPVVVDKHGKPGTYDVFEMA